MQLLCLGDVALADKNRAPRVWSPPGNYCLGPDAQIMFNWEFPIGYNLNTQPRTSGMRFLAYPYSVNVVQKWGPGIATIATNHILDGGEVGLAHTIRSLQQAGFKTVGAGMTLEEIERPLLWETVEGRLAIVNWVFPETHPDWNAIPGPNCWPGISKAVQIIQSVKQISDWVLLVVHWSDELFSFPLPQDRKIAGKLASAGADVIIGHHPHVVRGMEPFGNCPVFYSLGNFYFDEQRNAAGDWVLQEAPRNREGLGVRLSFQRGRHPKYEVLSFWNNKNEAVPDKVKRAFRRMQATSRILQESEGDNYDNWYEKERARFDNWDGRFYFGLLRRGLTGTLKRIVRKQYERLFSSNP